MTLGQSQPGRDLRTRYVWLGALMLLGLLALAINLYRLQVVHHEELLAKSEDNYVKEVRIRADRGIIKDRRGEILVDGRPSFDLYVTPAFCQKCRAEVLPKLAVWLGWDEAYLQRVERDLKAKHGTQIFQPMAVDVDLTRDELDVVNAHLFELPGVDVVPVQHRNYRTGPVLAHVLGYMNEVTQEELSRLGPAGRYALGDYIGRRGLERAFELRTCNGENCGLRGLDGLSREFVNARGEARRENGKVVKQDEVLPVPGNNLILSIDARLQKAAEDAFPKNPCVLPGNTREQDCAAGAVVVVEAKTGFILAMLSRPSFDPNELTGRITPARLAQLTRDPLQPMVFRPVAQHYSPGSTFKTFSLLAGLSNGLFTPHTVVSCPGGYRLGSRVWRCHKDAGHGPVDAKRALKVSCDTYFYKLADHLGIDVIAETGRALGLGAPTGIGVVAEVPGLMPDTAWHDRVTPGGYQKGMALNTVIGQGDVNTTPLQLVMAYAAIANGGTLYQPQLVKRIESADGRVLEEFHPRVVRRIEIDPAHRKVITDALVAVVNEPGGTAYRSRLKDVVMAGKTGTAQVASLGSVRLKKEQMSYFVRDHAWFVAYAPAEDPEIAVVVLNEHGGHGGSDAAPLAKVVVERYFELKKLDAAAFGGSTFEQRPVEPASAPMPPARPEDLLAPDEPMMAGEPGAPSGEKRQARR